MTRSRTKDPLDYRADREALKALGRYYYLSGEQLNRLLYSKGSLKYAKERLRRLTEAGYATPANVYTRGAVVGSDPWVWSRTKKGRKALDRLGYPSPVQVPEYQRRSEEFLGHIRDVNDALIAFERFASATEGVEILSQRHDLELKHSLAGTDTILDGYLGYFLWKQNAPMGIGLEVDRGTERRFPNEHGASSWDDKVRRLIAFASGPYRSYFAIESLTIAVVIRSITKRSRERLKDLLSWTEGAISDPAWLDLFRFTIADPTTMTPQEFVSGAHWVRLLGDGMQESVPLVSL